METRECILKRRSIRNYKNIPVKDEDIKTILEAAMAAPSAKNVRPWEFYVIKNKKIQDEIKAVGPAIDKNSPIMIVVVAERKSQSFTSLIDFWTQDLSAAIENMLLTATDLGLGSLWCGLFPRYEKYKKVNEILKLDSKRTSLAVIHLGYADEEKEPRTQYDETRIHVVD